MNNTRSEIFATPEELTRAFSYLSPEGKTHQPDHTAEEQHAKAKVKTLPRDRPRDRREIAEM